jgi:thiol-disulfide isomerase/thioredoxin
MKLRSIGTIGAAVAAAGATAAICFADALRTVPGGAAIERAGIDPPPADATVNPIGVLGAAGPWLSPPAGGPKALRGKVLVVNFWTYSCINSLRALPYLRAWSDRYGKDGLEVIGVHAPEFGFEKDPAKVRAAIAELGVRYPNLQDNLYAVWQDFANQGWPGIYYIDARGHVRGYRLGEGNYAEGERLIRTLLKEAGHDPGPALATVDAQGAQAPADWTDLRSPESYLGYAKADGFASAGGLRREIAFDYASAQTPPLNHWDLAGRWTVGHEFATVMRPGGAIRFRFHARDAHLVLGGVPSHPIRFRVTIDGKAPGASHGTDTDAQGWGIVREDRLYQLIRQAGPIEGRTLRIEFAGPGVRAYVFTFG